MSVRDQPASEMVPYLGSHMGEPVTSWHSVAAPSLETVVVDSAEELET